MNYWKQVGLNQMLMCAIGSVPFVAISVAIFMFMPLHVGLWAGFWSAAGAGILIAGFVDGLKTFVEYF